MREIKFRGKRLDNGEWVYGGYWVDYGYGAYPDGKHYIITWNTYGLGFMDAVEVVPETVGQYTGLKDKNGVEVYEGDILNGERIGKVYYEECQWFGACDYLHYTVTVKNAIVIGNIHDNPELLEVAK